MVRTPDFFSSLSQDFFGDTSLSLYTIIYPNSHPAIKQNFEDMLIDMPVIDSPPAELVNLVNELIDVGEPRMANDQGVQPLVLQAALLEEQARQAQVEEDAALADLLR